MRRSDTFWVAPLLLAAACAPSASVPPPVQFVPSQTPSCKLEREWNAEMKDFSRDLGVKVRSGETADWREVPLIDTLTRRLLGTIQTGCELRLPAANTPPSFGCYDHSKVAALARILKKHVARVDALAKQQKDDPLAACGLYDVPKSFRDALDRILIDVAGPPMSTSTKALSRKQCEQGDATRCIRELYDQSTPKRQRLDLAWQLCLNKKGRFWRYSPPQAHFCAWSLALYMKLARRTPEDVQNAASAFDKACDTASCRTQLTRYMDPQWCSRVCPTAVETVAADPGLAARPAFSKARKAALEKCTGPKPAPSAEYCAVFVAKLGSQVSPAIRNKLGARVRADCQSGNAEACLSRARSGLGPTGPLSAAERTQSASHACQLSTAYGETVCVRVGKCFSSGSCGFPANIDLARRAYEHGCGVKNGVFPKTDDTGCCAELLKLRSAPQAATPPAR